MKVLNSLSVNESAKLRNLINSSMLYKTVKLSLSDKVVHHEYANLVINLRYVYNIES